MAYLKLMMDEKEIAHLSEDGQFLCANEGVPQYSLPLNLFIGDKREVPLVDVVVWAKKRIFPKNRMDCKEILKMVLDHVNSKANGKIIYPHMETTKDPDTGRMVQNVKRYWRE